MWGGGVGTLTLNSPLVTDGAWHNLVGVWSGPGLYIYLDGILAVSSTGSGTLSATGKDSQIGTQCSGLNSTACSAFLSGRIDDVRIYNRALSAAEVAAIYNATR